MRTPLYLAHQRNATSRSRGDNMAAPMSNVDEIRNRVILGEYGVKNVSPHPQFDNLIWSISVSFPLRIIYTG